MRGNFKAPYSLTFLIICSGRRGNSAVIREHLIVESELRLYQSWEHTQLSYIHSVCHRRFRNRSLLKIDQKRFWNQETAFNWVLMALSKIIPFKNQHLWITCGKLFKCYTVQESITVWRAIKIRPPVVRFCVGVLSLHACESFVLLPNSASLSNFIYTYCKSFSIGKPSADLHC